MMMAKMGYAVWLIYFLGLCLLLSGLFMSIITGTDYILFSYGQSGLDVPSHWVTKCGLLLTSLALLLVLINLMLTVFVKRDKQLCFFRMSPLVWSVLILSCSTIVPLLMYLYSSTAEFIGFYTGDGRVFTEFVTPWYESHGAMLFLLVLLFDLNAHTISSVTKSPISARASIIVLVLMVVFILLGWAIEIILDSRFDMLPSDDDSLSLIQTISVAFTDDGLSIIGNLSFASAVVVYLIGIVPIVISLARGHTPFGPLPYLFLSVTSLSWLPRL